MNDMQKAAKAAEDCRVQVAAVTIAYKREVTGAYPTTLPAGVAIANGIISAVLTDASFARDEIARDDPNGMLIESNSRDIMVLIASLTPMLLLSGGPGYPTQGDSIEYVNLAGQTEVYNVIERGNNAAYQLKYSYGQSWQINTKRVS